ncbi:hypothetical protein [Mucilaginibacter antarcticus]|uniref:hypothetical protein n=1 Tax=Mucilaginibacter antarcticus TaxID=1855725 RepID=UPI00362971EE
MNESDQNKHILKELMQLLRDCALFLAKGKVDWRPFRLLDPISPVSDSSLILTFYADLEKLRNTEAIYPCISQTYHPLSEAIYYSESFNGFFQTHFSGTFQNLLIPLDGQVPDRFKNDRYKHQYLVEQVDQLSESLSLELRADLITILAKTIPYRDGQAYFSLLVNDQGKVIPKDELAFTPAIRADEEFRIPKSVKLDLMNAPLFDLLNARFEALYDKREPRSRELQRQVKAVVNLQPYDSNNVIDKIIAGTKDVLKSARAEDRPQLIREMVTALFANFKNIENRQERLKIPVTLIAKTGQPADSESLFLSQTYPTGEITEAVYGTTLKGKEYLADAGYWKLDEEESTLIESFFFG